MQPPSTIPPPVILLWERTSDLPKFGCPILSPNFAPRSLSVCFNDYQVLYSSLICCMGTEFKPQSCKPLWAWASLWMWIAPLNLNGPISCVKPIAYLLVQGCKFQSCTLDINGNFDTDSNGNCGCSASHKIRTMLPAWKWYDLSPALKMFLNQLWPHFLHFRLCFCNI